MSLILNHISYSYDSEKIAETKVIDDVSLELSKGEFAAIIGQTGSGKSTLAQHMNGLLKANSGQVFLDGNDVYDRSYNLTELRFKVGLVFQYPEYQLFEKTVIEDVSFGPKNMGLSETEIEKQACEALMAVNLPEELWDRSPFELSGGQKRRAAIAGILAMNPEYLVLDEPTAGLEPKGRKEILSLLKRLQQRQGKTIVLISHSMEDVAAYAERVLVMHEGRLVMNGTPEDVFSRPEELKKYNLTAPELTYLMADLKKRGLAVSLSASTLEQAKDEILRALKKGI